MANSGDKTTTFVADAIGDPEPVIVHGNSTKEVTIFPSGATDYNVYRPDKNATPAPIASGTPVTFRRGAAWKSDDIVAYVSVNSGSATFSQIENEN